MKKVSIVIVSYNVRYFLEQTLRSVYASDYKGEFEVIVVDNHSDDNSVEMVEKLFPETILIANQHNPGFSKANNQGFDIAKGDYILVLNPDTVIAEDSISQCVDWLENNLQAGALGARMIDGSGNYLPESKRGLPTPWVSFCKMLGLHRLFPRSIYFARYYEGYLSDKEINPITVLPGAFMFIRKEALDKAGWFDESFFMYGEDIDLSYRITLAGYKNYYFPKAVFLHYKGESTKRHSSRYIKVFYEAMDIFVRKHFVKKNFSFIAFLLRIAIYSIIYLKLFVLSIRTAFISEGKNEISPKNVLIVSETPIYHQLKILLIEKYPNAVFKHLAVKELSTLGTQLIGIDTVVMSAACCSNKNIIEQMDQLNLKNIMTYILPVNSNFLIGSSSSVKQGEIIVLEQAASSYEHPYNAISLAK